jgi:hypothetical protein
MAVQTLSDQQSQLTATAAKSFVLVITKGCLLGNSLAGRRPHFAEKKGQKLSYEGMSMRRVMLLALLVLALPTAALANSFSFTSSGCCLSKQFELGTFQSGIISGSLTNGGSFDVAAVGSVSSFSYDIGTLTQFHQGCDPTLGLEACFTFNTGSIIVKNAAGSVVLMGILTQGQLLERSNDPSLPWIFTYSLIPNLPLVSGGGRLQVAFTGQKLTGGEGLVFGNFQFPPIVPEPSALEGLLLGTGLLGLAEMARRKLKLGI